MVSHALLLLLALLFLGEPIGQGDWEKKRDPVQRRVASLLAGTPIESDSVAVVPLFARVPSEAGHGRPPALAWESGSVAGRVVYDDARFFLRVVNPLDRAVFVPAGAVFHIDGREVYIERDAVVPASFAALFPARPNARAGPPKEGRDFRWRGILPPAATGALLHGGASFERVATETWPLHNGALTYLRVLTSPGVAKQGDALEHRCARLADEAGGTAVGAVFLVANRPVAAHVFCTHDLFLAALPDLLHGVAVQAREWELRAGGGKALRVGAAPGPARGRAVAFLRRLLDTAGEWRESYGAGFEVVIRSAPEKVVGHAVVDHRRAVLHAAYYALGRHWPGAAAQRPKPGRPDDGGSETPPGVVDRKPRPSLSERRERDRKPR
ncbi:MAG: ARPP-1 family domain-containing protein [Planctomycetota bacterium]|jgi:hypothetical protein